MSATAAGGDCDPYHGVIVQIDSATRALAGNWETRAERGGIWSQGGLSSDGTYIFATTGNTLGTSTWGDGEAIVRLLPGLAHATGAADYYTPTNWQTLDQEDADLGGTEALPVQHASNPLNNGIRRRASSHSARTATPIWSTAWQPRRHRRQRRRSSQCRIRR